MQLLGEVLKSEVHQTLRPLTRTISTVVALLLRVYI